MTRYRHEQQRGVVRPRDRGRHDCRPRRAARTPCDRRPRAARPTRRAPTSANPASQQHATASVDGCAEPAEDAGDRVAPRRIHVLRLPEQRRVVAQSIEPDDSPRADDQDDRRRAGPRGGAVPLRHEQPDNERPRDQLRRDGRPDRDSRDRRPLAIAPRQCDRKEQRQGEIARAEPLEHDRRRDREHEAAPVAHADDPHRGQHGRGEAYEPHPRCCRCEMERQRRRQEDGERRINGRVADLDCALVSARGTSAHRRAMPAPASTACRRKSKPTSTDPCTDTRGSSASEARPARAGEAPGHECGAGRDTEAVGRDALVALDMVIPPAVAVPDGAGVSSCPFAARSATHLSRTSGSLKRAGDAEPLHQPYDPCAAGPSSRAGRLSGSNHRLTVLERPGRGRLRGVPS